MATGVAGLVATVAVFLVIFLICRAIVLWYWRVNEAVELLKGIDEKLGRIASGAGR